MISDLDGLNEAKRNIERKIENFFDGDRSPNYGDRGYQDLLERLDEIEQEIAETSTELIKWEELNNINNRHNKDGK